MKKSLLGVVAALAVTGILVASSVARLAEPPSIKDVMGKLCKGPNAAIGQLKKALGADSPDWDAIKAQTALAAEFGPAMCENEPPKGEKADYLKLAGAFAEQCKSIDEAAGKKDLATVKKSFEYLSTSCMGCHKGHKP